MSDTKKETAPKFTPGPWESDMDTGRVGADGVRVARFSFGFPLVEFEANARLIAAAPDMYEALEALLRSVLESYDGYPPEAACDRARAALAKARGE